MSSSSQIPLSRMLLLCGGWLLVVTLHFLLCGWLAWMLRELPELPSWVETLDGVLLWFWYGISAGLEFAWILFWWAIVGFTFWGCIWLVRLLDQAWLRLQPVDPHMVPPLKSALGPSASVMWPVLTLSLLDLLMLPAGSPLHTSSTGLEIAAKLPWDLWMQYLLQSLPIMAGVGLMLTTILILGSIIPNRVSGCLSTGLFFVAIVAGIAVMGGWVWLTRDLFEWLPRHCGYAGSVLVFFTAVTVLVSGPILAKSRLKTRYLR